MTKVQRHRLADRLLFRKQELSGQVAAELAPDSRQEARSPGQAFPDRLDPSMDHSPWLPR